MKQNSGNWKKRSRQTAGSLYLRTEQERFWQLRRDYPQVCGDKGTHPRNRQWIYQKNHSPCARQGRRETGTESRYCFQFCRWNQFPFCHATETARCIGNRKDGTALIIGAIPPNLKLLPYHRKPWCLRAFSNSPSRARTYNPAVNSRVLYHWAIEDYFYSLFFWRTYPQNRTWWSFYNECLS